MSVCPHAGWGRAPQDVGCFLPAGFSRLLEVPGYDDSTTFQLLNEGLLAAREHNTVLLYMEPGRILSSIENKVSACVARQGFFLPPCSACHSLCAIAVTGYVYAACVWPARSSIA